MQDRLTAKKRYEQLKSIRAPYLERGRACAKLTIPALLPPEGHSALQTSRVRGRGWARGCGSSLSQTPDGPFASEHAVLSSDLRRSNP